MVNKVTSLILEIGFPYKKIVLNQSEIYLFSNLFSPSLPKKLQGYLRKNSDEDFVVTKNFFNGKSVADIHRYDLKHSIGEWMLFEPGKNNLAILKLLSEKPSKHDRPITPSAQANNILIVIESPHKDEYDESDEKFLPLAPANGATGVNFLQYFASPCLNVVLDKLINQFNLNLDESKTYSICFVNPVPFQASLHFIFKDDHFKDDHFKEKFKEKVWKVLFTYCNVWFTERVRSYNPSIIINACTCNLKNHVKDAIDAPYSQINCNNKLNAYHPSSWYGKKLYSKNICSSW